MATTKFTVLLLYPDYLNDTGAKTFYTHAHAPDLGAAIQVAKDEAAYQAHIDNPDDFALLFVCAGFAKDMSGEAGQ